MRLSPPLTGPLLALALTAGLCAGCAEDTRPAEPAKAKPAATAPPAKPAPAPVMDKRSLLERLGGEKAVTAVVDEFLSRIVADRRINKRFEGANVPRLRAMLIEQICAAAGGPKPYSGMDMVTTHTGMGITDAEFDAIAEDLVAALDKFQVPAREKGELLGAVGGMRYEIVERPSTAEGKLARMEIRMARLERTLMALEKRLREGAPRPPAPPMAKPGMEKPPMAKPGMEKPAMAKPGMEKPAMAKDAPRATPWTAEEKKLSKALIERYANATVVAAGEAPSELLGQKLSQTRFFAASGEVFDLKDYEGKKKVVLVILRGFAGQVCINCSSQTLALATRIAEFRARNAEVVLVYPGEAETLPAFLEAVRNLQEGFEPPFPLVLDVDLAAVKTFRIEGSLARPTSIILDEKGVVRFAYTGKQPADRPSAKELLTALDGLK